MLQQTRVRRLQLPRRRCAIVCNASDKLLTYPLHISSLTHTHIYTYALTNVCMSLYVNIIYYNTPICLPSKLLAASFHKFLEVPLLLLLLLRLLLVVVAAVSLLWIRYEKLFVSLFVPRNSQVDEEDEFVNRWAGEQVNGIQRWKSRRAEKKRLGYCMLSRAARQTTCQHSPSSWVCAPSSGASR